MLPFFILNKTIPKKGVMIIKQQKICDVNYYYKVISFITEEFVSNKVLWTFEKNKELLNRTKDKNKSGFINV